MIIQGDVLDVLQQTPDEHYSAVLCDPPYGLGETPDITELLNHWLEDKHYDTKSGFMGKKWDVVPGPAIWKEVYRVLRPGAILMAFGGTRTADLLSIAIRLAGFERFDEISYHGTTIPGSMDWITGQGFPKGCDISKQIDKEAGIQPVDTGLTKRASIQRNGNGENWQKGAFGSHPEHTKQVPVTLPATDAAKVWSGYNVALKPAHEPILLFRKPRKATYAQTAIEHGTSCLNIDGCRIGNDYIEAHGGGQNNGSRTYGNGNGIPAIASGANGHHGRWPANIILSEEAAQALDEMSGERPSSARPNSAGKSYKNNGMFLGESPPNRHSSLHNDSGGPSRYFYCAKSSRSERGEGNNHPCCKPLKLVEHLARLILPPVAYRDDARLLVPFAGSMSEVIGAMRAGWIHIDAIEMDAGYIEIGKRRIAAESADMPLFAEAA